MTRWPPPYPRVPHLFRTEATARDDLVLVEADAAVLLSDAVSVEEKIDGANVMLWSDEGGRLQVATRGGPGAADRAGQLGPLRAWTAARSDSLRNVLASGSVLYGEWLWLAHRVHYDRLPDWLLGLDILHPDGGWLPVDERNAVLDAVGLKPPPELYRGDVSGPTAIGRLLGRSRLSQGSAEGVVVRALDPASVSVRLAKVVDQAFTPLGDSEWKRVSERNKVSAR